MSKKDIYKYYCLTEGKWIREKVDDGAGTPTVCRNDPTHDIDLDSISITYRPIKKSDIGLEFVADTKNNFDAEVAPNETNDITEDYSQGSQWINILNNKTYICTDNTTGSAVWKRIDSMDELVQFNGVNLVGGGISIYNDNNGISEFKQIAASSNLVNVTDEGNKIAINVNQNNLAIDATQIGDGTVNNTEFSYLNTVTSNIQTQLDSKLSNASNIGSGNGLVKAISGNTVQMKSLIAGTNVTLSTGADSITINAMGGNNSTSHSYFHAYDAGGNIIIILGWTDISWDTEVKKDAAFSHNSNSAIIEFNETAFYDIHFDMSLESTAKKRSTIEARVLADTGNGYNEVGGTRAIFYCHQSGYGGAATIRYVRQYNAGDKIKLQADMVTNGGIIRTLPHGCRVTVMTI